MFSYADVMLADAESSAVGEWISQNIKPEQLFPLAYRTWPDAITNGPILDITAETARPVKIGSLWWPFTASRYARAHFVVSTDQLAQIRENVYAGKGYPTKKNLTLSDGTNTLDIPMWMLPAWPLATAVPSAGAYLLTLVDDRYHWWDQPVTLTINEGTTTWNDLYTSIGSALGITIAANAIPAAYGKPNSDYMVGIRSAAAVLDAVAWSVQQRIVVDKLTGNVTAQNATTAIASVSANLAIGPTPYAGGELALKVGAINTNDLPTVPSTIEVVFRADGGAGSPTPPYVGISVTLASLALPQYGSAVGFTGWTKTLHRYERATYSGGSGTPTNNATLTSLAKQFATDWYLWQLANLDQYFVGDWDWTPEGMHEIEWTQSENRITTRVARTWINPREDLLYQPDSAGSPTCPQYREDCFENDLWRYKSTDCGVTWTRVTRLTKPLATTLTDVYCNSSDKLLHTRQRLQLTNVCEPFLGPWFNDMSTCVTCCPPQSGSIVVPCVTVQVPCCDNPLPCVICVQVISGGTTTNYTGTYSPTLGYWVVTIGSCTIAFMCSSSGSINTFELSVDDGTGPIEFYDGSDEQCTWLLATFTTVNLSNCGGASDATVYITTGPCPGGMYYGTNCVSGVTCCAGAQISKQLCVTFTGLGGLGPQIITYGNGFQGNGWYISLPSICSELGGGPGTIFMVCNDVSGSFNFGAGLANASSADTVQCTPFVATFHGTLGGGTFCDGPWTATVSDNLTSCGGSAFGGCNAGGGGGGGTIGTTCCPNVLLPQTVVAVFTGTLSPMGHVTLTYTPTSNNYTAIGNFGCGIVRLFLDCILIEGSWQWYLIGSDVNHHFGFAVTASSSSCSPFALTFNINMPGPLCGGVSTCTVS